MEFKEAVKIALQSLWANKLRSILTLLGVVIGVASVIAVVTLVNGANVYVASKVNKYGADTFTISKQPQIITSYEQYTAFQKRKNILLEDYLFIAENCKHCEQIGAQQTSTGKIVYGTQSSTDTVIRGQTYAMPEMQNLNIVQGRAIHSHGRRPCLACGAGGVGHPGEPAEGRGPDRQGDSRRRRSVHDHRPRREAGQDAGTEPGQLGRGSAVELIRRPTERRRR